MHPESQNKSIKSSFTEAQSEVNKNLKRLDVLKPRINKRYDRAIQLKREAEARRAARVREQRETGFQTQADSEQDFLPPGPTHQLEASTNQDLAVRLAQKEISRRAAARLIEPVSTGQKEAEQRRRSEHAGRSHEGTWGGGDDLSRRLQEVRAQVEPRERTPRPDDTLGRGQDGHALNALKYKYPTIPSIHAISTPEAPIAPQLSAKALTREPIIGSDPPSPPPKPPRHTIDAAPLRPEKVASVTPPKSPSIPTHYTFAPAAYLESGTPLRTLFLPPTLRTTFLRIAHRNTLSNLETCAFLAGTLISNALFVSKLIVPEQTATSDTCEMTNESQLFDYVDSEEDLMILGWIHTHPTQTCFMSSRDLHTHAGYQMMLAESVALVCAPSKGDSSHGGDWGVYRLTDPPGKTAILTCQKPGTFHPHDVDHVYTDALRPGHVVEADGLQFELVDLRDRGGGR